MALTLEKQELQVKIARSAPGSDEQAKLVAELLAVETKLSAGGATRYLSLLTSPSPSRPPLASGSE